MILAGVQYSSPNNIFASFFIRSQLTARDQALGMTGVCLDTSQCAGGLSDGSVGFYTNGDCPNGKALPAVSGTP
jgi:hypothetical protein